MFYATLFISLDGRLNRKHWWFGFISLVFASLALIAFSVDWQKDLFVQDISTIVKVVLVFIQLFPLLALNVKRFHDLGYSGVYAVLWPVITVGHLLFGFPNTDDLKIIFTLAELTTVIGSIGILGFVRGSKEPNRYGTGKVMEFAETAVG